MYDVSVADPETERLVNLLKVSLKILGISLREVGRRIDMSPSYVSKLLANAGEVRLDHIIRICRAAEIEPVEFFALAYPRHPAEGSPAASRVRHLLKNVELQTPAARAPTLASTFTEEQLHDMLKATLAKMLDRNSRP
ncbi:MAG TPA: helix-turn-helix transcriptional regulator [Thermoanaerobaculia bacterium]|nr:helix-turn-helix transcriptional regulator [Thermoanaerobaculia bacterium]